MDSSAGPADVPALEAGKRAMTVRGAAFLGVGSMVGAGIFALLGEAGAVAGSAVWLPRPDRRGHRHPPGLCRGQAGRPLPVLGRDRHLPAQGFGPGHITAITSWLLYFASIIVTAMVAVSFGSYGSSLFFGEDAAPVWGHVLTTAVVLVVAVVNIAGARFIDRVQSLIVLILLAVFAIFIVVTSPSSTPTCWPRPPTHQGWTSSPASP